MAYAAGGNQSERMPQVMRAAASTGAEHRCTLLHTPPTNYTATAPQLHPNCTATAPQLAYAPPKLHRDCTATAPQLHRNDDNKDGDPLTGPGNHQLPDPPNGAPC